MIFIGVNDVLAEKPWDDKNPSFFLQKPSSEEAPVVKNFTKPNVYFVGTKRGCSCDFSSFSNIPDEEYREEREALSDIIEEQLLKGNTVEVYCCWAGDYDADIEEQSIQSFTRGLAGFYIDEKELIFYNRLS